MQVKSKLFNFTDRTVNLLKIVSAMNKTSETETLEIALELMASPEVIALITNIHGERMDRKSLRKPRKAKKKQEFKLAQQELININENNYTNKNDTNKEDDKIVEEVNYADCNEERIEEQKYAVETMLDLNSCTESLLDMYA